MPPTLSPPSKVTVAVTQAEPVWLNLEATVDKTCKIISEAAKNGAQLVAFPEVWIPGYPAWIWNRPVDTDLMTRYIQNSMRLNSDQMGRIRDCAAEHNIVVVLGFSQNDHDSLYIAQAIIDATGEIKVLRKKMKPTHMERTVFGDSFGDCLDSVADTAVGRVGALNCWEHLQPLLKYHTYSQREQIHVAAWPPLNTEAPEGGLESMTGKGLAATSQVYAMESASFVLHSTSVISQAGVDLMKTGDGDWMNAPGGGSSAIFGPDGKKLTADLPDTEEGILYATIDLDDILQSKAFIDVCGHYSRPDLLWLGVDKQIKRHVRFPRPENHDSDAC
ncbi:Arylacetonitrilase [Beauveria bassiana]|nr:Arylacetonitrilase [Beauveria bassiana]KAH8707744.1 Arylacetonitrilase [Beauveria bassiana]